MPRSLSYLGQRGKGLTLPPRWRRVLLPAPLGAEQACQAGGEKERGSRRHRRWRGCHHLPPEGQRK
jgi:hypothetical protein